ncbi:hypothetical protein SCYAM73S_01792 [Streptomyces cyaneofuscatus]
MNFWPARNPASCLPPSPSSFTIVPAVRAGRSVAEVDRGPRAPRPTSSASRPRSSSRRRAPQMVTVGARVKPLAGEDPDSGAVVLELCEPPGQRDW